MSFTASYAGACSVCLDGIQVGDLIGRYDGGYAHQDCIDRDQLPPRTGVVCETCFLEKPCECDDEARAILDRLGL